jgi:hypothetical protein
MGMLPLLAYVFLNLDNPGNNYWREGLVGLVPLVELVLKKTVLDLPLLSGFLGKTFDSQG